MNENGTKERSTAMAEKIYTEQLFRRKNLLGQYEYTINCVFCFSKGGYRIRSKNKITVENSNNPNSVRVLFHVVRDGRVKEEFLSFTGRIGRLGIDDEIGTIEYYLVIHPNSRQKNPPVKKSKGSTKTGTAKEEKNLPI